MRKITVMCDDDVEVISITTKSEKPDGVDHYAIGIFDVQCKDTVEMPDIKPENEIRK